MEKIKEEYVPVYNSVVQVKSCASYMLGEEVTDAKIAIVIGHNGMNFVSSTDWRLTTASGRKRILPFSMRPQYPNFLECVGGVSYTGQQGQFTVLPDKDNPKQAKVIMGEQEYFFAPGEALKMYVLPNTKFIATDCVVDYQDTDEMRIYRVDINDDTIYGQLDKDGHISQV